MPSVKRKSERPSDTSHWLSAGWPASGAETLTPIGPIASLNEFSVVSCSGEAKEGFKYGVEGENTLKTFLVLIALLNEIGVVFWSGGSKGKERAQTQVHWASVLRSGVTAQLARFPASGRPGTTFAACSRVQAQGAVCRNGGQSMTASQAAHMGAC
jgi:hypothetical protein